MNKRLILSLFASFIVFVHAHAQTILSAEASAGYAFNTQSLRLGEEKITNADGFLLRIGILADFPLGNGFFLHTGAQGVYLSVSGEVGYSRYRARGFKFYVPFLPGYKANESLSLYGGIALRNAKDLSHFHIASMYNFRYDVVLRATYTLQPGLKLTASYSHDIGISAAYLLNDPQSSFTIGMLYRIAWNKKKQAAESETFSHHIKPSGR